jgi:hypothetical protein
MAVGSFRVPAGGGASTEDWVRPSDWLAMPTVTDVEQKFVGLHAIFPEGNNFAALLFTTSTGQYQVDWGDGSSPTLHNSNTKAEYAYDYATYDTGNTTLSSRGYKQAIITVTPVSGNLLTCNFQQRYTGQNQAYATGFLDCIISMPNHSASAFVFGGTTVRHAYVERFDVKTLGSCNSLNEAFRNCSSLQSLPLFTTSSVTNMVSMFNGCISLKTIPLFNTSAVLSMQLTFSDCRSLKTIPLINTSLVQTMSSMFINCSSLSSLPLLNTTSCLNMSFMFQGCAQLFYIPSFTTSSVTNMQNMFFSCGIKSIPSFTTTSVNAMQNMFGSNPNIQSIPALSTAAITTIAGSNFNVDFAGGCNSLDRCQMVFARTVGFANCQLSATALNEIFTNLVDRSATTQASITITGNYGAATANTAIATAKNWQVIN